LSCAGSHTSCEKATNVHFPIDKEIDDRLRSKYRWSEKKYGPRKILKKFLVIIGYHLFGVKYKFPYLPAPINFGYDRFGRDVASGLLLYLQLLQGRGLAIRSLVVLGSRAKGTWHPESDVDVLVILQQRSEKRRRFFSDHPLYASIEPTVCYDTEFMQWINECRLVALDAMYYGVIAFDDGFWAEAVKVFGHVERERNLPRDELLRRLAPI
jgi:hypothetical protein